MNNIKDGDEEKKGEIEISKTRKKSARRRGDKERKLEGN